jgi:hypothetical protein
MVTQKGGRQSLCYVLSAPKISPLLNIILENIQKGASPILVRLTLDAYKRCWGKTPWNKGRFLMKSSIPEWPLT